MLRAGNDIDWLLGQVAATLENSRAGFERGKVAGPRYDRGRHMVKRSATVDEILAAIEAARDKVMADEVKSLTKLGIPKAMAYQMIATRYRQKVGGGQEEAEPDPFESTGDRSWDEIG